VVKVKRVPQRMCVGCQEMKGKRELIRVVRTPDNEILIDPTGKKSGRGAYICPRMECLEKALKGKHLGRALQRDIEPAVVEQLKAQLRVQDG
jgi:predicted RNA-binding protein YlxR (DUF448 family)